MNSSLWIGAVASIGTCIAAVAAVWGLRYARGLIGVAVNDRQVDRVLALHKEVTTGEIAAARNRFSELMYRAGEEAFGPRKCWRPSWDSLIPPNPAVGPTASSSRFLGAYPKDMVGAQDHRPIHDLRLVLWSYDRVNEARKRKASLDEGLLVSLMGHTVVWWSLLCERLDTKSGAHVRALMELALWMEDKGWRNDPRNAYRKIPEDSFPGTEDEVPPPRISTTTTNTLEEVQAPHSQAPRGIRAVSVPMTPTWRRTGLAWSSIRADGARRRKARRL
jgi:hypothetical protein